MKPSNSNPVNSSRREFGRRLAFAVAASAVAKPLVDAAVAAPMQEEEDLEGPELTAKGRAEVEAKFQHLIATYGDRLNDEQRKKARRVLERHVRMLESVRQFSVANGDSPASVLKLAAGNSTR